MTSTRQLAAIMFTDIVGYTAMMGKDSNKALEQVRQSKDIQKPLVEKFNGIWLKEMGDGAMAQFSTALDAVNCAIEIQRVSRADFESDIRIGIHLGDITIENNDIYGDGVNIASRLESIADPGGIYISDAIEKAIRGQLSLQAKFLGEITLKNVDYGVRSYALQGVGLPVPEIKEDKHLKGHLWAEVQRRGILRAGIAYLVLALLLILLWNQVQTWINLPQWSYTLLTTLLGVGFPIALFLAWHYERSPGGFVKTTSQKSWQNPYTSGQRKPLTSNSIILTLAAGLVIIYVYQGYISNPTEKDYTPTEVAFVEKSIAVIPFTNMSDDASQEYFSDGMMEEILNHLVKIEDLQVTSRTSVMRYKGTTKSIVEIAKELGVATVLEGSVRKAGDRVRITVQLIDGKTDKHLWSETFERYLDDVFAIQSEVAQHVADILQAEVQPEIKLRIESQPTVNTEAYNLFLQSNFQYRLETKEGIDKSKELLERVIEIDPEFADALAYLGQLKSSFSWGEYGGETSSPEEAFIVGKPYYERALKADPKNENALLFSAFSDLWYKWDFEAAGKKYQTLIEINPNFSWADFLIASGRFEEAVTRAENGVEINPLSSGSWAELVLSYYFNDQHEEALRAMELGLNSDFRHANLYMDAGRVLVYLGRYDQAIEHLKNFLQDYEHIYSPRPLGTLAIAYYHKNDLYNANDLLNQIKQQSKESSSGSPSFYIAMIYSQMGEIDLAFQWLDKAYQDHEVEMYWLKVEPPFEPLRNDPRWQEMLDKVGFPE